VLITNRKWIIAGGLLILVGMALYILGNTFFSDSTQIAPSTTRIMPVASIEPTVTPFSATNTSTPTLPTNTPTPQSTQTPTSTPTPEPTKISLDMEWPDAPAATGPLSGVDPTGQRVIWWHNYRGNHENKLLTIVGKFNQTNPYSITVEILNLNSYDHIRDKMRTGVMNSELPGVVVGDQIDQALYASVETLVDMNLYVNDPHWGLTETEKADFVPRIYLQDVHRAFGDQRLGFPFSRSMEVLYYNKTWMEELGFNSQDIITPERFEEVACAAAAASGDGKGGYIIRFDASQVAAAAFARGGNVLIVDDLSYNYNSLELIDYFTQIKRMYDQGCAWVSPKKYHDAEFAARQGIFYIDSTKAGLPFIQTSMEKAVNNDEWGIAPQPYPTDTPTQNVYGESLMMPKGTPQSQLAAWIFIKWLTSPGVQIDWVRDSNNFSPRLSVAYLLTEYLAKNPQYAEALVLLPYTNFEPQLLSYREVRQVVNETFQTMIRDEAEIEAALSELEERANLLELENRQ
jgi:multiple sugar transport system substrate-binding protein/sn-glycerol 3-phosphate transport system substrate-binding protein